MSDHAAPAATEATPPAGNSLLKKLKVAGVLAAIVFVQCAGAYFFLSHGDESTAVASTKAEPATKSEQQRPAPAEQTEVDLGAFSLTVFNPKANNNLLIDFHLYGTVSGAPQGDGAEAPKKAEDGGEDDAAKLEKLLKGHKHRFRDQVITTVRNSQIADLADPGLGLLKRQILAKTNALLGEPLLKEIIFSDFVIVEQ